MYPMIDKERTGRRIRQLMKERGISVKDVRDFLALESVQSVYYWMSGRSIPSIDNLYALSVLLQVPIDDMLCGNRAVSPVRRTHAGRIVRLWPEEERVSA